jgi:hypothetical protein
LDPSDNPNEGPHVGRITSEAVDRTSSEQQIVDKKDLKRLQLHDTLMHDRARNRQLLRLRENYATILLWLAISQAILGNIFFALAGFHSFGFTVNEFTSRIFFVSIFAEVYAIIQIIVKHLFPNEGSAAVELLERLERVVTKTISQ